MKNQIIIICCIIAIISSCEKYPDPSYQNLEGYRFRKSGSDQKAFACNYLNDSISVQIENSITNSYTKGFRVQFNVMAGGGSVDQSTIITDNNGFAYTNWKLGEETCQQLVRANVLDYTGKLLTEIDFRAFGFRYNTWDTVTTRPDIRIFDMVADTINNMTLMTTNNTLYRQGNNYFDWDEVKGINMKSPRTIEMDSEGTLYLGNWNGELVKSFDQGETWLACTNPIPDYFGYFFLVVSSDNYIWVNTPGYALHCSRDGGFTWTCDSTGLAPMELLGDVFRLTNGTLLFHSLNCHLYKSEDDGKTWTAMEAPEYSIKLYVTENDEIIIINQDYGISIYKSTDMGENYTRVYSVMPEFGTLMDHIFHKYGDIYYVLVPGYGILKTPDLENFEIYWRNTGLNNLFMDHNGGLIARDWEWDKVYYRRNSE